MGRDTDIHSIYPETIQMAAGTTAIFGAIPGQIACTLKYSSGGTLSLVGSSQSIGSSFAVAQKYLLTSGEIFNFDSAGQFSVECLGATCVFYLARSRSAGFSQT